MRERATCLSCSRVENSYGPVPDLPGNRGEFCFAVMQVAV